MQYWSYKGIIHRHGHSMIETDKEVCDMTHVRLDECHCSHVVEIQHPVKGRYVSSRYHKGVRQTVQTMISDVLCQIMSEWFMQGKRPVRYVHTDEVNQQYASIKANKGQNQVDILAYFDRRAYVRDETYHPNSTWFEPYKLFDLWYHREKLGLDVDYEYMKSNVWMEVREKSNVIYPGRSWGQEREPKGVPSLLKLALKKTSWFNLTYGGWGDSVFCPYSLEGAVGKIASHFAKLNQPTHEIRDSDYMSSLATRALPYFIKGSGYDHYKSSIRWDFESQLDKAMDLPMNSSHGVSAGKDCVQVIDGVVYKHLARGKKKHNVDRVRMNIINIKESLMRGEKPHNPERGASASIKNEIFIPQTQAELEKMQDKLRVFHHISHTNCAIGKLVHGDRQMLERCHHISIGMNFWDGGAYRLAKFFKYDSGKYTYFTGDFSGLDRTLKAGFLKLYAAFSAYYQDERGEQYELYLRFLELAIENLTFRCTHLYGDIWRMLYGGMPSGAYETSHGDSWIVCLIYYMYFVYTADKFNEYSQSIYDMLSDQTFKLKVFGDDSILAVPKELAHVVSIYGMADFVTECFDMSMRDLERHDQFLSVPDGVGGLKKAGVCYLSRYFIARESVTAREDISPVLPYRLAGKIIRKFAHGSGERKDVKDYLLSAMGMTFDSMGTNPVAYYFCSWVFSIARRMLKDGEDIVSYAQNTDKKYVLTLLKKLNISVNDLTGSFPTVDQLLDRHVLGEGSLRERFLATPTLTF